VLRQCVDGKPITLIVETPNQQIQSEVISFAKQHLPPQTFGALNWQALRPVILADTVFGWFAYPTEA
jgi:hypothetical protein